jgi:hypothetical protein
MKPLYRVFSKSGLMYVTAFLLIITLQLAYATIKEVNNNGIGIVTDLLYIPVIGFVILLLCDIWLLTSSILPVIEIDSHGIKAYSIFWSRKIAWKDIKDTGLILCKSQLERRRWVKVSFERTGTAQRANLLTNKGVKVRTFIIISPQHIQAKPNLELSLMLFSHKKVAACYEIAFEYEPIAWQVIQSKLINQVQTNN